MPPRQGAVNGLMLWRYGTQVFDGRTGDCLTMPDYWDRKIEVEAAYVALVETVDWARVLFEARRRHLVLDHADKHPGDFGDRSDVCAECLEAAMLQEETLPDWTKEQECND